MHKPLFQQAVYFNINSSLNMNVMYQQPKKETITCIVTHGLLNVLTQQANIDTITLGNCNINNALWANILVDLI